MEPETLVVGSGTLGKGRGHSPEMGGAFCFVL